MKKLAVALLSLLLSVQLPAMNGKEYKEFRDLINEVTQKANELAGVMLDMKQMTDDTASTLQAVEELLKNYSPSRWEEVAEQFEQMQASLNEWKGYYDKQLKDCTDAYNNVLKLCSELENLVAYGYKKYVETDKKVTEWLALLSTIPLDKMATKEQFARAFGYYGVLEWTGYGQEKYTISFDCDCKVKWPDEEYESALASADYYAALATQLEGDFEEISEGSIPQ